MAFDIPGFERSWPAGGTLGVAGSDLSVANTVNSIAVDSYRYMFVKFSGGLLVPIAAATDNALGVLQNKPQPGQMGEVMISGVTKVRSSDASIVVGTPVYIDAYGMVTHTVASNHIVGIAEEVSATATGYVIAVCLKPFGAMA
jgi:predicted RecA/RadA family phage recombinase